MFAVIAFAVQAILLPPLYLSLAAAVRRSYEDQFVENVRAFSRIIADQVELGHVADSPRLTLDLLDSVILGGDGVYAELRAGPDTLRSELSRPGIVFPTQQDFAFGAHDDNVYYLSMQLRREAQPVTLYLGFDERQTAVKIHDGVRRVFWTLASYMVLSMLLAVAFGNLLARPVNRLQRAVRRVASGEYAQDLHLATYVRELQDLSQDLDHMRTELLNVIHQRTQLEHRLQHRHRLETVGTLAGGIAHEFNNVLVPIMLLTEYTLQRLPADSGLAPDLEAVLSAARRARDLVRQVLTFSRELSGARLEWSDLRETVQEALRLFEPLASPRIGVELDLAPQCPRVRLDRTLAVQLILNLLTNASQSMQGAPGRLQVGLRTVSRATVTEAATLATRYVELSVADTGHGINAETLEHIFEPFFTTRGVGDGTGLGLSVVHGIAESFGATIAVESEVGRGSTFRVFFPAEEGLVPALEP
jgi:signal transduction histidine kinase